MNNPCAALARCAGQNKRMSDAGNFVDRTLPYEATRERAAEAQAGTLQFYGASVGAGRGTNVDDYGVCTSAAGYSAVGMPRS